MATVSFLGQLAADADIDDVRDRRRGRRYQRDHDQQQQQQQVLASDRLYQSVRPALSQDGSNVYINVGALVAWGQQQGATSEQLAAFGQVRAMGTSWRSEPRGDGHGRLLVIVGS